MLWGLWELRTLQGLWKVINAYQQNLNLTLYNSPQYYGVLRTLRAFETLFEPVVVQSLSHVWFFVTPWTIAHPDSLSFTISQSLLKLMSIESVMPSNHHLILCCPLLLLPSISPSIRVFFSESALCIRWPKYWSFSLNISPFNEYSGLISFRIDCFDLLAL